MLRFNPVRQFRSFLFIFDVNGLIFFNSLVMYFFPRARPLGDTRYKTSKIITANKSNSVRTAPPTVIVILAMLYTREADAVLADRNFCFCNQYISRVVAGGSMAMTEREIRHTAEDQDYWRHLVAACQDNPDCPADEPIQHEGFKIKPL